MILPSLLWAYILVFIFAAVPFFEAFAVIPIAIIAGLSSIPVIILGLAGNILTVLLLILFIDRIKEWRKKRKSGDEQKPESKRSMRAKKIWKKYGLPGLAFIGPLFVGSHLTAFMSLSFGGTKKTTIFWMVASITTWSITFAILIHFGIDLFGFADRGLFKDVMPVQ